MKAGDGNVIQAVGTNYRQTPVTVRERIALSAETAQALMDRAAARCSARECVVLSTCNRVELYYVGPDGPEFTEAAKDLFPGVGEAGEDLRDDLYHYSGEAAVTHLFEVASGLDSMILGEHEVLGQVRDALPRAAPTGHTGPVLTRLFYHAVRAGKRARRETAISSGIFSVGQCAARVAEEALGGLRGKQLLLFGAGRIAKVTAKHMASLGVAPILVLSRTQERAQALAREINGQVVAASEVMAAMRASDILVGCASAPHHVVDAVDVQEAIGGRGDRPLVVVDLGVPRNVDPAVGNLPGVRLYNIDDLEAVMAGHVAERESEIKRVRCIVSEEVRAFCQWHGQNQFPNLIPALRAKAEEARQECLRLAARRGLSESDLATADYITDLLVRKLLHDPIVALRDAAGSQAPDDLELYEAVERIFGLTDGAATDTQPACLPEGDQVYAVQTAVDGEAR